MLFSFNWIDTAKPINDRQGEKEFASRSKHDRLFFIERNIPQMSLDIKENGVRQSNGNGNGQKYSVDNALADIKTKPAMEWAVKDAETLYRVHQWGQGYFSVNELGN